MSLQIWMPLDNTFKNHGLLGPLTQTYAPTYVNEKFGKSLSQGSCKMSAQQTSSVLNNKAISICFWVYINADAGTTANGMLFGTGSMIANNNRKYTLINYPTVNDLHWSWQNDTANTPFTSGVLEKSIPSYKWTHVAVTYENPNGTIYINGEKKQTFTGVSNSSSFSYETQVLYNLSYMYRNDFRIYDNCLSAREVKEISKGMICHYPMNQIDGNNMGRNLLVKTNQGNTLWSNSHDGGTYACESVEWLGVNAVKMSCTTKTTSWKMFTFNGLLNNFDKLEAGKQYTLSYDTNGSASADFYSLVHSSATSSLVAKGTQTKTATSYGFHYVINLTLNDTLTKNGQVVYFNNNLNNGESVIIANLKLEKGSVATSWIPASEDFNISDNTVYDTSGYSNHGTFGHGEYIECNSDSPRYDMCYKLNNGGSPYINAPNFSFENMTQGTVSIWINRHSFDSVWRNYLMFANSYNWVNGKSDFIIFGTTGGQGIVMDCCSNTYSITPNLNTWYLYTLTWDFSTNTAKYYVNGELKNTKTNSNIGSTDYTTKHNYHFIGNALYTTSDYSISDFRLYSTALSDSDVKELYNSPISLTNTGILMTQGEFKEV